MEMKPEIKVGMVIDDYKLKDVDKYWIECLKKYPDIEGHYRLIKEESFPGLTDGTTTLIRVYTLKG